jgi:hypothetical protein
MDCRVHTLLRGFFIFLDAWGFVNASGATARVGAEVFAHVGFGRVCAGELKNPHPLENGKGATAAASLRGSGQAESGRYNG